MGLGVQGSGRPALLAGALGAGSLPAGGPPPQISVGSTVHPTDIGSRGCWPSGLASPPSPSASSEPTTQERGGPACQAGSGRGGGSRSDLPRCPDHRPLPGTDIRPCRSSETEPGRRGPAGLTLPPAGPELPLCPATVPAHAAGCGAGANTISTWRPPQPPSQAALLATVEGGALLPGRPVAWHTYWDAGWQTPLLATGNKGTGESQSPQGSGHPRRPQLTEDG